MRCRSDGSVVRRRLRLTMSMRAHFGSCRVFQRFGERASAGHSTGNRKLLIIISVSCGRGVSMRLRPTEWLAVRVWRPSVCATLSSEWAADWPSHPSGLLIGESGGCMAVLWCKVLLCMCARSESVRSDDCDGRDADRGIRMGEAARRSKAGGR